MAKGGQPTLKSFFSNSTEWRPKVGNQRKRLDKTRAEPIQEFLITRRHSLPKKSKKQKIYVTLYEKHLKFLTQENAVLAIGYFSDQRDRNFDNMTIVNKVSITVNEHALNIPNLRYDVDNNRTIGNVEFIDIGYCLNLPKRDKIGSGAKYKFPLTIKTEGGKAVRTSGTRS